MNGFCLNENYVGQKTNIIKRYRDNKIFDLLKNIFDKQNFEVVKKMDLFKSLFNDCEFFKFILIYLFDSLLSDEKNQFNETLQKQWDEKINEYIQIYDTQMNNIISIIRKEYGNTDKRYFDIIEQSLESEDINKYITKSEDVLKFSN